MGEVVEKKRKRAVKRGRERREVVCRLVNIVEMQTTKPTVAALGPISVVCA